MSSATCWRPRPALMMKGAPKGPLRDSLRIVSRLMIPSVSGVAGSSETSTSVRARKASNSAAPAKLSTPGICLRLRLQPATRKPMSRSLTAESAPMTPSPMMPTLRSFAAWVGKESHTFFFWFSSMRRCWRWCISTCSTMYSVMRPVRSGSLTRTIGMLSGSVGSFRIASTPAPSDMMTLRLGRLFTTPGGGSQAAQYSMSATLPMPSGQTRTSRPGATFLMAAVQTSTGHVGRMKRNAITDSPHLPARPSGSVRPRSAPLYSRSWGLRRPRLSAHSRRSRHCASRSPRSPVPAPPSGHG